VLFSLGLQLCLNTNRIQWEFYAVELGILMLGSVLEANETFRFGEKHRKQRFETTI
jgi:hypothetical protein